MKKRIALLLSACICLLIIGCGGKENGGHKEHKGQVWYEANCQHPRTCAICGYTEGGLGDHSTNVGTCVYCNVFQNKALCDHIVMELTTLSNVLGAAEGFLESMKNGNDTDRAAAVQAVAPTFADKKASLENIASICNEYGELASVKAEIEKALSDYPALPAGTSAEESHAYMEKAKACCGYLRLALSNADRIS